MHMPVLSYAIQGNTDTNASLNDPHMAPSQGISRK